MTSEEIEGFPDRTMDLCGAEKEPLPPAAERVALEAAYAILRTGAGEDRVKAWDRHRAKQFADGSYYLGRAHAKDAAAKLLLPIMLDAPGNAPVEASPPQVMPPIRDAK